MEIKPPTVEVKKPNIVLGFITHGCGWEHAEVKRSKTGSMYVKCDACNSIDWRRSQKAEAFELLKMRPIAAEEKADILSGTEVQPAQEIEAMPTPAKKKLPVKKPEAKKEPAPAQDKNPDERQTGETFGAWMDRMSKE